jgi:hypothetical protein
MTLFFFLVTRVASDLLAALASISVDRLLATMLVSPTIAFGLTVSVVGIW